MPKQKSKRITFDYDGIEVFNVEKILEKKGNGRNVKYKIRWEGYSEEHDTWEPASNITTSLISQFEAEQKRLKESKSNLKSQSKPQLNESKKPEVNNKNGFELGFIPEKLIAAEMKEGKLRFLIKWKNKQETEQVIEDDVKQKCPQLLIQFYEKHLEWSDGSRIGEINCEDEENSQLSLEDDNNETFTMQPERIFGSKYSNGELIFAMKWMNSKKADLVKAKIANKNCPDLVIKFYEERIKLRN